ncbi:MAG: NAD+ synthase [Candidatus Omnitrophica bacterium]|nr:NAD+ synthase [Candidatus Omnitrophota bacterium]
MVRTRIRIACAQVNPTVGALFENYQLIISNIEKAKNLGADIVVFPELCLTGYPPEDLLFKEHFVRQNIAILKEIAVKVEGIIAVVGFVDKTELGIFNASAIIANRRIQTAYHKTLLPNSGVFDEKRYFVAGNKPLVFCMVKNKSYIKIGVAICEDVWHKTGPLKEEAQKGAKIILVSNASPFHLQKFKERQEIIRQQAKENKVFIVYVNMVGGQDELVFDGRSFIVDSHGKMISQAKAFAEDLLLEDLLVAQDSRRTPKNIKKIPVGTGNQNKINLPKQKIMVLSPIQEIYQALVLGLRDYVHKNGFTKVIVGLSGGIDSSLVATIAADALGKENVIGVFMPSRYSSPQSQADAQKVAENLGITFKNISIEQIYQMYLLILEKEFLGTQRDVTEENIQARIRGNILMALSNKFGWLVLNTANKSEISCGYTTLYGDLIGGFAVLKDVPKTVVYELASYCNSNKEIIPATVFKKEPTAELRYNQKDSDTLPEYKILDGILKFYIEYDMSYEEIIKKGYPSGIVERVIQMVDKSEYKRRQSPPGVKITPRAFGRDRRMPITNKYRGK